MINIRMQHKDVKNFTPRIMVVGVGGAGGNAVNNMIASGLQGAEFIVCNTDAQALDGSLCEVRLQLGETTTGGLGAGAKPDVGRAAAEETLPEVMQYLEGANMAFITAGMGGGTGTGAAPVIARACREKGILTVGVVTKPFHFEGAARMRMAEAGIKEMQDYVDTLIVIPNQNLFRIANEKTTFAEAFRLADTVLQSGVRGVTDLIVRPGEVNLDFADIKSVMLEMGKAMMGTGEATGERRAVQAAEIAINNPLLDDVSMKGARAVIINITGGPDMTLFEFDEACNRVRDEVDPNAVIIVGSSFDQSMEGVMRVSVIATGIDAVEEKTIRRVTPGVALTNVGAQNVNAQIAERRNEAVIRAEHAAAHSYAIENALPRVAAQMQSQMQAQPVSHATIPQPARAPAPAQQTRQQSHAPVVDAARQAEAEGFAPARTDAYASLEPQQAVQQPTPAEITRAVVYGNSFIPPKPVEVDPPRDAAYHTSPGGLAAQRRVVEDGQVQSGAGLNLRPPVPGASFHARKKAPSLFDRITNRHQPGDETIIDTPTAAPSRPGQTVLGVEQRKPEITDDELDIPAFLRRQAN